MGGIAEGGVAWGSSVFGRRKGQGGRVLDLLGWVFGGFSLEVAIWDFWGGGCWLCGYGSWCLFLLGFLVFLLLIGWFGGFIIALPIVPSIFGGWLWLCLLICDVKSVGCFLRSVLKSLVHASELPWYVSFFYVCSVVYLSTSARRVKGAGLALL